MQPAAEEPTASPSTAALAFAAQLQQHPSVSLTCMPPVFWHINVESKSSRFKHGICASPKEGDKGLTSDTIAQARDHDFHFPTAQGRGVLSLGSVEVKALLRSAAYGSM
jgi:hypothetical protein